MASAPSARNFIEPSSSGRLAPLAHHGAAVGLILLIALFYGLTIRQGHEWGDDFAMYIHQADNIVANRSSDGTGFVFNPHEAGYSPAAYPPMFPALLAPVIKLYGHNLTAMKLEQIAFFALALGLIYVYYRRELPWPYLLALIAILGFNPSFWEAKDRIGSDIPFLMLVFLSAALVYPPSRRLPAWWGWGQSVALGLTLYVCCSMRSLGLTLLPGLVLYELARHRKLTRLAIVAPALCLLIMFLQRKLLATSLTSYTSMFLPTVHMVLSNAIGYSRDVAEIWPRSAGKAYAHLLFVITLLAAAYGVSRRARRGWTPMEAFLPFYAIALLLWPGHGGIRYLYPFVPVYLFYALLGFREVAASRGPRVERAAAAVFLLLIAFPYAAQYRQANYGTIPESVGLPSFVDLCRYIDRNTGPADIFVFRRPRALSLFAGRPTSIYTLDAAASQPENEWAYFRQIEAKYAVVATGQFPEDAEILMPALESNSASVDLVYRNSDFALYRLRYSSQP